MISMQFVRVRFINSEKTKGCEKAPVEVLKALKKIKSNEARKLIEFGRFNLEEIHVDLENVSEAEHLIFENSKEIFEKNFKSFFIGGDHSIDYSIVRAFDKVEDNGLLIMFDAHADCLEDGEFNRSWLRRIIEEGFESRNIILISVRNLSKEEIEFIEDNEISFISMDVLRETIEDVCDMVMERAMKASGFYVSIDIDCVEPGSAPGACELEPGGLSSRELIYFLKRLSLLKNFRGADVVEINPDKDINEMTIKLGAKLIVEMI